MSIVSNIQVLTHKTEDSGFLCLHEKAGHYIIIIFQSQVLFSYDMKDYFTVPKNSIIVYSPDRIQAYRDDDSIFINSFCIFDTTPDFFDKFNFPLNKIISTTKELADRIILNLSGMAFILNTNYFPEKRALVPEMLADALKIVEEAYNTGIDNSLLSIMYSIREDIFNDPIQNTTKILAQKVGYSESYFCDRYKKVFGTTPGSDRQQSIVKKIKNYLISTNYPLEKIAELCSIASTPFLIKIFKKYEHITPHQYRLNYYKENKKNE